MTETEFYLQQLTLILVMHMLIIVYDNTLDVINPETGEELKPKKNIMFKGK